MGVAVLIAADLEEFGRYLALPAPPTVAPLTLDGTDDATVIWRRRKAVEDEESTLNVLHRVALVAMIVPAAPLVEGTIENYAAAEFPAVMAAKAPVERREALGDAELEDQVGIKEHLPDRGDDVLLGRLGRVDHQLLAEVVLGLFVHQ